MSQLAWGADTVCGETALPQGLQILKGNTPVAFAIHTSPVAGSEACMALCLLSF